MLPAPARSFARDSDPRKRQQSPSSCSSAAEASFLVHLFRAARLDMAGSVLGDSYPPRVSTSSLRVRILWYPGRLFACYLSAASLRSCRFPPNVILEIHMMRSRRPQVFTTYPEGCTLSFVCVRISADPVLLVRAGFRSIVRCAPSHSLSLRVHMGRRRRVPGPWKA